MDPDFAEFLLQIAFRFKNVTIPSVPLIDSMHNNLKEVLDSFEGIIWYWRLTPRRMNAIWWSLKDHREIPIPGSWLKGHLNRWAWPNYDIREDRPFKSSRLKLRAEKADKVGAKVKCSSTYFRNDLQLFQLHQCIFYIKIAFLTKLWGHKLLAASV